MKRYLIIGLFISGLCLSYNDALTTEFGGYECKVDCSGHKAGYDWAEDNNINDERVCFDFLRRHPNRRSFFEGCLTYVEEPDRGSDFDDDGEPLD